MILYGHTPLFNTRVLGQILWAHRWLAFVRMEAERGLVDTLPLCDHQEYLYILSQGERGPR